MGDIEGGGGWVDGETLDLYAEVRRKAETIEQLRDRLIEARVIMLAIIAITWAIIFVFSLRLMDAENALLAAGRTAGSTAPFELSCPDRFGEQAVVHVKYRSEAVTVTCLYKPDTKE